MPLVREIFQGREMYKLAPNQTVQEAARYMAERNVGAVCVLEGGRLVGIFSERDILKRVLAADRDPKTTRLSEVMTTKPVLVEGNDTIDHCARVMQKAGVRHLPVVEGDNLLGLVSLRDLLQSDLSEKVHELKLMQDYIYYVPPAAKPEL